MKQDSTYLMMAAGVGDREAVTYLLDHIDLDVKYGLTQYASTTTIICNGAHSTVEQKSCKCPKRYCRSRTISKMPNGSSPMSCSSAIVCSWRNRTIRITNWLISMLSTRRTNANASLFRILMDQTFYTTLLSQTVTDPPGTHSRRQSNAL